MFNKSAKIFKGLNICTQYNISYIRLANKNALNWSVIDLPNMLLEEYVFLEQYI